jgi:hypothetical protein
MLGFGELLDEVGGVAERSRQRAARQRDRLIEWTFPGHDATPQLKRDSSVSRAIRSARNFERHNGRPVPSGLGGLPRDGASALCAASRRLGGAGT